MSTARELIIAQRAAYVTAARTYAPNLSRFAASEAVARYPFPTITRPRILDLGGEGQYRVNDAGQIEFRYDAQDEWGEAWFEPARVRALAALLDNPTETVELP